MAATGKMSRAMSGMAASNPLADGFGRRITYLRVSVTDRCDLRCVYCMSERMTFAPRDQLLTTDELERLCSMFIERGVKKLRFTGGEPLMRRDLADLIASLARHRTTGALDEITLTTNGTQLAGHAAALKAAGIERINVSLDTLDRDTFRRITRRDRLPQVLAGIEAAREAGMAVKINTVALRHDNCDELRDMIAWAHGLGMDMTLIETMPLGEVEQDRTDQYLPLSDVRARLAQDWTLTDELHSTGGPARYVRVQETGGRLGFIAPISQVFCASCNRVRLTCTGRLFLCLGRDASVDLASLMRRGVSDGDLGMAIDSAVHRKPEAHDFRIERSVRAVDRHMSVTGG